MQLATYSNFNPATSIAVEPVELWARPDWRYPK
jgi:hypothetical protein